MSCDIISDMENHISAFIDESGNTDINSKKRSLILAAIVTKDTVPIQRSIKTAEKKIRTLTKDNRELKAYRQSLRTRQLFLKQITKNEKERNLLCRYTMGKN